MRFSICVVQVTILFASLSLALACIQGNRMFILHLQKLSSTGNLFLL